MTSPGIRKIVIVGGGTAGWIAAATLARVLSPGVGIELVESDDIGTVGVGEATIPQIRLLLQVLGIREDDFMRHTGATIKLGIQFNGWHRPGERYMHAFGALGRGAGLLPFHHYWLQGSESADAAGNSDLWDYSLNQQAAIQNRFALLGQNPKSGLDALVYAFHFDAGRVAQYLRVYAERLGVQRQEGRIVTTHRSSESGDIESVELESSTRVAGDLFLDCSGFRALLIGQVMKSEFEDWSEWLPCDRAIAVPSKSVRPITPYTQATARSAGWQWRIPLQSRIGNGHVFSSQHISEDEATSQLMGALDGESLAEPLTLRFTTGMRRKVWERNCIALGLAAGFMEPLESTSIHLVQTGVDRLLRLFPVAGIPESQIREYNRQTHREYELIRDFLVLHYFANERSEPFWKAARQKPLPDSLTHKLELFQESGVIVREAEDLFAEAAWLQVMVGQGVQARAHHRMAQGLEPGKLQAFLQEQRSAVNTAVNQLTSHDEFISQYCAE